MPAADKRPPVLVVAGPTAAGKSALALALAEQLGGVVINADSMQVYRELAILTARPGPDDLARVPHRLYGVLPGAEACSAGRWRDMALHEIEAALSADRLPILAGGTGLYLRALQKGLAEIPQVPPEVRAAASQMHERLGGSAFHAALGERDPETAARLPPGDRQRLIRAWEVLEATGRPLAHWIADQEAQPPPYRFLNVLVMPPREQLYLNCNRRFEAMIAAGALEEVKALRALALAPTLPVMKSLGVSELLAVLEGREGLPDAIAAAQQRTRRYAKRQMTWLRNQVLSNDPNAIVVSEKFSESFWLELFNKIRQKLLTPPP